MSMLLVSLTLNTKLIVGNFKLRFAASTCREEILIPSKLVSFQPLLFSCLCCIPNDIVILGTVCEGTSTCSTGFCNGFSKTGESESST